MKKKNRVKKSLEFQELIHTGKKLANASFVMYFKPRREEEVRVGITLSKKIGNAVKRNLYKRQTRMICMELVNVKEYPYDFILILRQNFPKNSYDTNKKNLEKLLLEATII